MYAILEPTLALAGLVGIFIFAIGQAAARRRPLSARSSLFNQAALFLGLAIWTVLFLLRHDVVSVVGLLLAMVLLHRRNQALANRKANENGEKG